MQTFQRNKLRRGKAAFLMATRKQDHECRNDLTREGTAGYAPRAGCGCLGYFLRSMTVRSLVTPSKETDLVARSSSCLPARHAAMAGCTALRHARQEDVRASRCYWITAVRACKSARDTPTNDAAGSGPYEHWFTSSRMKHSSQRKCTGGESGRFRRTPRWSDARKTRCSSAFTIAELQCTFS